MDERDRKWLDDRIERLEARHGQLEKRCDERIERVNSRVTDGYSTIFWLLFILLVAAEIAVIAAAAASK